MLLYISQPKSFEVKGDKIGDTERTPALPKLKQTNEIFFNFFIRSDVDIYFGITN
jgi:hypothetical protein